MPCCSSKKEKYECCGIIFKTKEELEEHEKKMHKEKPCCT